MAEGTITSYCQIILAKTIRVSKIEGMISQQEIAEQLIAIMTDESVEGWQATHLAQAAAEQLARKEHRDPIFLAAVAIVYMMEEFGVFHEMTLEDSLQAGRGTHLYGTISDIDLGKLAEFRDRKVPTFESQRTKPLSEKDTFTPKPPSELKKHRAQPFLDGNNKRKPPKSGI